MFVVCKVSDAEMKEPCNLYKAFPVSEIVCFVLAGADEQGFVINCEDFGMLVMLNGCLYTCPTSCFVFDDIMPQVCNYFFILQKAIILSKITFILDSKAPAPVLDLSLGLIGEIQYLLLFFLHKIALKRIGM